MRRHAPLPVLNETTTDSLTKADLMQTTKNERNYDAIVIGAGMGGACARLRD